MPDDAAALALDEEDALSPDHVPGPGADIHDDEATEPEDDEGEPGP